MKLNHTNIPVREREQLDKLEQEFFDSVDLFLFVSFPSQSNLLNAVYLLQASGTGHARHKHLYCNAKECNSPCRFCRRFYYSLHFCL